MVIPGLPDLGGQVQQLSLDLTVLEEAENTWSEDGATFTNVNPSGYTGLRLSALGDRWATLTGEYAFNLYTLKRSQLRVGFNIDGQILAGGGRVFIDENGVSGYGTDGSLQTRMGTDGTITAANGALVMNALGIVRTGITYFDRWDATDGSNNRRLEIATALLSGTTLAATITWYDSATGTNLQTDGDIEAGDLGKFTSATDGGAWSADTGFPADGTYAAKLNTTAYNTGSELQTNGDFETSDFTGWTTAGTGTWLVNTTNPRNGTYSARLSTSASQTGTLTTNLGGTPRMAVTALKYYIFSVYSQRDLGTGAYSTLTMAIKWYTATSGGSLISTTTNNFTFADGSYTTNTFAVLAPATAAGAEIVITANRTAAASADLLRFDDISFKLAQGGSLTTNLGGTPRMAVTAGNSYFLSYDVAVDNSLEASASAFIVKSAYVKWYTATSGGSLISTDTIPFTLTYNTYVNFATTLTAPATAAGAEFVVEVVRSASYPSTAINFYVDNVVFQAVTVNLGLRFQDGSVSVFGTALQIQEQVAPTVNSGYGAFFTTAGGQPAAKSDDGILRGLIGAQKLYDNTLGSDGSWDIQNSDLISGSQNFADYDNIEIHLLGIRSTAAVTADNMYLLFGTGGGALDTTAANYSSEINASGTAARADTPRIATIAGTSADSNMFTDLRIEIYFPNSSHHKNSVCFQGNRVAAATHQVNLISHAWENTGTITRIGIRTDNHSTDLIASGSRIVIIGYKF